MIRQILHFLLLIGLLVHTSCTVRVPIATHVQQQHSSAELITNPQYSVKNSSKRWLTLTGVSLGAGGLGYLFNHLQVNSDEKYSHLTSQQIQQRGLKWGAAYTVGTFLVGAIITKGNRKVSTRKVDDQDFNKWLYDYSKVRKLEYTKYRTDGNDYLIIPRDRIADYENEERRRKEAAERGRMEYEQAQRRLAQEKIEQEAAVEKKAFEDVLKNSGRKYWITYLTRYPNGTYIEKVKEEAESNARFDVLALNERGAWETYISYFPGGKNIEIVRAFEKLSKKWDSIMDGPNQVIFFGMEDTPYAVATKRLVDIGEFEAEQRQWLKSRSSSEQRMFLFGNPLTIEREKRVLEKIIERGNKRKKFAENLVQGDNLCLTLRSFSIDDKGEKIKGTEGETLIRLTAEDFNQDKSRIKITVKEIYNITRKRKVTSFSFDKPRRIWEMDNTDWIDPADWDFEYCK